MKSKTYKKMLIIENYKLEVVTMLIIILVITKHLKNYLEIFIAKELQYMKQKVNKKNLM